MKPPIADPHQTFATRFSGDNVQIFRVKFWPCFIASFLFTLCWELPLVAIIIYPVFARRPEKFPLAMGIVVLATALLLLVIWVLSNWLVPLKVSRWGIAGFSFWGAPTQIAWSEIKSVNSRWLAYPCVVVATPSGQNVCIVWLLQNSRGFAQAVAAHTTPDHPLHLFLQQRGLLS